MSRRVYFKGEGAEKLKLQIDELTGFMSYKEDSEEVVTFTKVANNSFYEVGKDFLHDYATVWMEPQLELLKMFGDGTKHMANVYTADEIKYLLEAECDLIHTIKTDNHKYLQIQAARDFIAVLEFAVEHNLEIREH